MKEVDLSGRGFIDVHSYFTSEADRSALISLFDRCERILEIGIQAGGTARLLLSNLSYIQSYIGIDVPPRFVATLPLQRTEVPLIAGLLVSHDPRVHLIVKPEGSIAVTPEEVGECDGVFIDADHSSAGVERDTALARGCVKKGVIVWHDYRVEGGGTEVNWVLDRMVTEGREINHVRGTWLAFERIG